MPARILAVARMSALGLFSGRGFVIYFCLLAFPLVSLKFQSDIIGSLLTSCDAGVYVAAYFALQAVADETRQRTLTAVLVRPVAFWEYLAGRALALVGLFVGFVVLCALLGATFSAGGLTLSQLQEFISQATTGTAWIVLLVPLAALIQPWPCIWMLAVGKLTGFVAQQYANHTPLFAALKTFFYYGTMSQATTADGWVWAATLVDNLAYAGVVFLACQWLGSRRDARLREV